MNRYPQLNRHGLFDAKVPRYTSYPPANHFLPNAGHLHQRQWLSEIPEGAAVSLYLHVPFCRRLCWFCACRTQGTQSQKPVEEYVRTLISEIGLVRSYLPENVTISRLHIGGGTPTIMTPTTMSGLLDRLFEAFGPVGSAEFSVELDPTDTTEEMLRTLARYGMNRASVGVQDFAPRVQQAIGRLQSYEQTRTVVEILRQCNVTSLNMDLLYGLPFQTEASLSSSLDQVLTLNPDRIALYGYAHVPWMSKRQVMIDTTMLPSSVARYELSELARHTLLMAGFEAVGIDHFARPGDSLAVAAKTGDLRRNFQGYTDDTSDILIGLGASAISKFPQGYSQNISATSAYTNAIRQSSLAGKRGYPLTPKDKLCARLIEELMCTFQLDEVALQCEFPENRMDISQSILRLIGAYPDLFDRERGIVRLKASAVPLARIIAHSIDQFVSAKQAHSAAI
ncbi:MAG: oxygen-independent coproporphyrinogen III oxidase [Albidovulum sp.]